MVLKLVIEVQPRSKASSEIRTCLCAGFLHRCLPYSLPFSLASTGTHLSADISGAKRNQQPFPCIHTVLTTKGEKP